MQVTVFKSTDGQFFETFDAYKAHEEAFLVAKNLQGVELNTDASFVPDDSEDSVIAVADLPKFIADNAQALREVLAASVVAPRKGRGPNKNKEAAAA